MDYFEAFLPCHDRVKLLGTYKNRGRCSISFLWRGYENAAGWSKKWTLGNKTTIRLFLLRKSETPLVRGQRFHTVLLLLMIDWHPF